MPSPEARAYEALSAPDREHLELVRASWSMLADFCFSDLVLYLRDPDPADEARFVMTDHVRPATSQTIYHADITGEVRAASQRPLVAEAYFGGVMTEGVVDSAWLDEQVQVRCIPVRHEGRVIAVLARESALSLRRQAGELERAYQQVFDRFVTMIAEGSFPFAVADVDALRYRPRVGDGVVVLDAAGTVEFASPNANSALTRAGFEGNLEGRTVASLGVAAPWIDEALTSGEPRAGEVTVQVGDRESAVVTRVLPLSVAGEVTGAVLLLRDVSDLRRRDRELLSKDATIQEIHHRVKNNLQTISSLLRLQGRRLTEQSAKDAIEESVRRIRTIALVHEVLSLEPRDDVAFIEVVRPLVRMVEEGLVSPDRPLRIQVTGDPGEVPANVATSLAVVVTELLQNIVEHAYPGPLDHGVQPDVRLDLHRGVDRIEVAVLDDGVGLPSDFDDPERASLGMSIVRTLVESELRGTIRFGPGQGDRGTEVMITVPLGAVGQPEGAVE